MKFLNSEHTRRGEAGKWHSFAFNNNILEIIVVREAVISFLCEVESSEWIEFYQTGFNMGEFFLPHVNWPDKIEESIPFGFQGSFICKMLKDENLSLTVSLQSFRQGVRIPPEAATLMIMLNALNLMVLPENPTQEKRQLLAFETCYVSDFKYDFSLILSPSILEWLEKQSVGRNSEASSALYQAYIALDKEEERFLQLEDFQANFSCPIWVSFLVPGSACSLHPESRSIQEIDAGEGYKLVTHNLDNLTQMLSLICGVAKLYELVEKDSG